MTTRLAVLPARGGSKRIPRKNVRDFCGRPMLSYPLRAAVESGLFDCVHVSTDDPEVAAVAASLGQAPEFGRPDHLADDHTPLMPVLRYVVEQFQARGRHFDEVWLLMPCAPFVDASELLRASEVMNTHKGTRPLLAVARYPAPVEWAFEMSADQSLVPERPGMFAVRSQDLRPKYFDTGTFVAYPTRLIAESVGAGSESHFVGHEVDSTWVVDIDDEEDWRKAEELFRWKAASAGNTSREAGAT